MKHSNRWTNSALLLCAALLLLIMYRREARERAMVSKLEGRITALENYTRGLAASIEQNNSSSLHIRTNEEHIESHSQQTATKRQLNHTQRNNNSSDRDTSSSADNNEPIGRSTQTIGSDKFSQLVKLELNTVDSVTLIRVPGIGENTARAILSYRKLLGGYYSTEQLRERIKWEGSEKYLDEWCNNWFWVDIQFIQKLPVNTLSFKELIHHPYLNYNQVKAICQWRDRHKRIVNRSDIEQMGVFSDTELERLMPYIEF